MSETWTLFALLALFYFTEGIWWTPRLAACVFATLAGRRGIRAPLALSESAASGVLLPPTLVCTGRRFIATSWPASLSPDGVSSRPFSFIDPFEESDAAERFLPYAEAAALDRRGAHLVLGGQVFARADSARDAARLHALILDLASLPEAERAGRIREVLDRSLDVREARRRIRKLTWLLRRSSSLPSLYLAALGVFAPLYTAFYGIERAWPFILLMHLVLAAVGLYVFLRVSRVLPTMPADERLYHAVMILMFPPATPRYPEHISRGLVSDLHPLAVAAAVKSGTVPRSAVPAGAVPGSAVPGNAAPGSTVRGNAEPRNAGPRDVMRGKTEPRGAMPGNLVHSTSTDVITPGNTAPRYVPRDECRRFLRRIEVFIESAPAPGAGPRDAVERWFAQEHRAAVHRALEREGVAPESLAWAPTPEPDAHRYCPACHAQYRADAAACPDCPGVQLEPFATPTPEPAVR